MIRDTVKNVKLFNSGRCYKANEEIGLRFYQMPKTLFNNPKYKGLSLGAKAMYSILRDRIHLSIKNNLKCGKWIDENDNIYLLFKVDPAKNDTRNVDEKEERELSLTELLEVDRKTVMRYKKELVVYNLIIDKRMGQGKTNRIYVLKPELPELPSKNVVNYEKSQEGTFGGPEKGLLEVPKRNGSDTDLVDTYISDTQSFVQVNKKENNDRRIEYKIIKALFWNKLNYKDLKVSHPTNKELIDEIEINILDMYLSDYVIVQGKRQPQEIVRSALMRLTYWHIDTLITKYMEVSSTTQIKSPKAYIQTMIYNIALENELAIANELKHVGAI